MAPSLAVVGMAALAYVSGAAAVATVTSGSPACVPTSGYELEEEYKPDNFFDKFTFKTAPDLSNGFVKYQGRTQAEGQGLVKTNANDVYLGVDYATYNPSGGRNSVRIESISDYESGLFIADFAHLPKPVCGAWPAFWMYGPGWPENGEMDIYEGWNLHEYNKITAHTSEEDAGACNLASSGFSGTASTTNCDVYSNEYFNQGCSTTETNGQWGKSTGGIYAMEWTDDFIKVWSWGSNAPADVTSGTPQPTTWGTPHFALTKSTCDIEKSFNTMKLVLNINLCGDAPSGNWVGDGCKSVTQKNTCQEYVAQSPTKFIDTFFKVRGIKVFQNTTTTCPAPSSVVPSASVPSVSHSVSVPSVSVPSVSVPPVSVPSASVPLVSVPSASVPPVSVPSASAPSASVPSASVPSISAAPSVSASLPASGLPVSSTSEPVSSASEEPEPSYCEDDEISSSVPVSVPSSVSSVPSSVPSSVSSAPVSESTFSEPEDCSDEPEPSVPSSIPASTPSSVSATSTPIGFSSVPSVVPSSVSVPSVIPSSVSVSVPVSESTWSEPEYCTESTPVSVPSSIPSSVPPQSTPSSVPSSSWGVPSSVSSNGPISSSWSSSVEMTTSTVYDTTTYTVTKCPPTVTNCPYGHVVTETIAVSTTVCPVTATPTPTGWTTSTVYATTTYTISKCAPTVKNCPYGHVTTEIIPVSTTICPVTDVWPAKPTGPAGGAHGDWPAGGDHTWPAGGDHTWPAGGDHTWPAGGAGGAAPSKGSGSWPAGGAGGAAPSKGSGTWPAGGSSPTGGSGSGSAPVGGSGSGSLPSGGNGTTSGSKPIVVVSGGAKTGISLVAVLAGAMLVMGL